MSGAGEEDGGRVKADGCLTLLSAALLFIAAVFTVVLAVAAERRRDALTVPALQQTLTLTSCTQEQTLTSFTLSC